MFKGTATIDITLELTKKQWHVVNTVVPTFNGAKNGEQTRDYTDWRQLVFDLRKEQKRYQKLAKKTKRQEVIDLEMELEAVYMQIAGKLPAFSKVEKMVNN